MSAYTKEKCCYYHLHPIATLNINKKGQQQQENARPQKILLRGFSSTLSSLWQTIFKSPKEASTTLFYNRTTTTLFFLIMWIKEIYLKSFFSFLTFAIKSWGSRFLPSYPPSTHYITNIESPITRRELSPSSLANAIRIYTMRSSTMLFVPTPTRHSNAPWRVSDENNAPSAPQDPIFSLEAPSKKLQGLNLSS